MNAPNDPRDGAGAAPAEAPQWLLRLLYASTPESAGFRAACEQASEDGLVLAKLRRAAERTEPTPLTAPEYLRGLAAVACVSVEQIAAWAGFPDTEFALDRTFALGWGRLARAIGLDVREALLHLHLAFVDQVEPGVLPAPSRARAIGPRDADFDWGEYEAVLLGESLRWPPEVRDLLRTCTRAVHEAYDGAPARSRE